MEDTPLNSLYVSIPGAPKRKPTSSYADPSTFDDFLPFLPLDAPLCESAPLHHTAPATPAFDSSFTLDKRSIHKVRLSYRAECRKLSITPSDSALISYLEACPYSTVEKQTLFDAIR